MGRVVLAVVMSLSAGCATGQPVIWVEQGVSLSNYHAVEVRAVANETGHTFDFDVAGSLSDRTAGPWRPLIAALAWAGCAAPLLLTRGIYYQGDVTIVVVSREQAQELCSVLRVPPPGDVIRGCWIPASRTVITEPDPAVLAHELQHARGERPMD
jgi:hypothetical protein